MASSESTNGCRIAITQGDYNGIGPEVVLKSLDKMAEPGRFTVLWFAHPDVVAFYEKQSGIRLDYDLIKSDTEIMEGRIHIVSDTGEQSPSIEPGQISVEAGKSAMRSLEQATDWCINQQADALVTAPISKESMQKAGFRYPGHTEYLANRTASDRFIMMMVHDSLRVSLITIHIPVRDIADHITTETIIDHLKALSEALRYDFGIEKPSIALLGLNPHAGDGGVIGTEEQMIIIPAIADAASLDIDVAGPFAADGFFASRAYKNYDAVVAMYHDQGLIPFKTISDNHGVNVTGGLPIIRTSPDHGTAFDIAGMNRADPGSFTNALLLASDIHSKRCFVAGK